MSLQRVSVLCARNPLASNRRASTLHQCVGLAIANRSDVAQLRLGQRGAVAS
jgi:hypothetical protein